VLIAVIVTIYSASMTAENNNAAYSEDYGSVHNILIGQGFSYTYTPIYPSDLTVTTTIGNMNHRTASRL
jgi:hypothetical protein